MYPVSGKDFYFPMVIGLLRISRRFPIPVRRAMNEAIVRAAYGISFTRRRSISRALDRAFPERLSAPRKRAVAKGTFHHFWREAFWAAPSAAELDLLARIPLRGEEHLRGALSRGAGLILLEAGLFGSRNLARRVLHARGYAIHQVYGIDHDRSGFVLDPDPSNWGSRRLRDFFKVCESDFLAEIIYLPSNGSIAFTRELVDRLKRNCIVAIAGSGRISQRLVTLPFFGMERSFSTGIVNLARTSGAALLPLFGLHRSYGDIEVVLEPPIDVESAATREANLIAGVRRWVELLESYCRKYPEQFNAWGDLTREDQHGPII